jgi:hypothetical protein
VYEPKSRDNKLSSKRGQKTRFKRVEGKQRKIWHGTRDKPVNREDAWAQRRKNISSKIDIEILAILLAIEGKIELVPRTVSFKTMAYILVERYFAID